MRKVNSASLNDKYYYQFLYNINQEPIETVKDIASLLWSPSLSKPLKLNFVAASFKLVLISQQLSIQETNDLKVAIAQDRPFQSHKIVQPRLSSTTQATSLGLLYSRQKLKQLSFHKESFQESSSDGLLQDGRVTVDKWALTRKQARLRDTSFETQSHDIYNPSFSSSSNVPDQSESPVFQKPVILFELKSEDSEPEVADEVGNVLTPFKTKQNKQLLDLSQHLSDIPIKTESALKKSASTKHLEESKGE